MIERKWSTDGEQKFYRPDPNKDGIELVGVSDTSINVTYNKYPDDEILDKFNVTNSHAFCDYYAIETFTGGEILKIYDQDLSAYPLPSLPPGSRLDPLNSGIGIYYPGAVIAKIYFLHDDVNVVHEWFKDLNPVKAPAVTKLTFFGLEYNLETLELTNLSQYDIFNDEEDLNG